MKDYTQTRLEFSKTIQDFRTQYKMTQSELGHLLKCDVATIRSWESNKRCPRHPKYYQEYLAQLTPEAIHASLDFYRRLKFPLSEGGDRLSV